MSSATSIVTMKIRQRHDHHWLRMYNSANSLKTSKSEITIIAFNIKHCDEAKVETRETMARKKRRKIDAIYRDVAGEKPSSFADAISAAIRRYRSVAFPLGVLKATAAGPTAGTYGTPFAPSTVHRGRPCAHVHALFVDAPLDSHASALYTFYTLLPLFRG